VGYMNDWDLADKEVASDSVQKDNSKYVNEEDKAQ